MSIKVRILQANHGDCILITHEDVECCFNLLIDGGNAATFKHGVAERHKGALCSALDELKAKKQCIDLAILTHIDDDHIGGFLKAFKAQGYLSEMVKSIWFNSSKLITDYFGEPEIPENNIHLEFDSPNTSAQQGKSLEAALDKVDCQRASLIIAGQTIQAGPFTFKILSPNEEGLRKLLQVWPKEKAPAETSVTTDYQMSIDDLLKDDSFESDSSIPNGSSIAFILSVDGINMLFLGDAHDEVVVSELHALGYRSDNKLPVKLVKVSHHGSKYNTSPEFLNLVHSNSYIISSNGAIHGLPDKRTIARIMTETDATVLFNYEKIIQELSLKGKDEHYSKRLSGFNGELNF
ncbi:MULTISPECIES: ComEC/Rec2 family competence protein [Enterobacteriaceae]|uniref:ComEC/Rec2 family competence protein n=1 Tax=Enterobacteriaceae TaxID=543 RepID=UPI0017810383|nr:MULTISPECIES: MBL fold metallo-hydrolase [Enterobacteriaceae]MBD9983715.1 MBL fold metallo-hydrolase [Citrobacter portucalensis]MBE0035275.1 MBL fold metallo-hydrolase [Citrobacter portucalensis]MBE0038893.1 MBL fold metallo-hydrolase [Citrobacter portucalensis]MBE0043889.1 MBL fold metallo-hydrolase [Citrobacter portucalensis]MBE0076245.1 MBL fold metallo-hydrolase [Citrobacter portucalensis]